MNRSVGGRKKYTLARAKSLRCGVNASRKSPFITASFLLHSSTKLQCFSSSRDYLCFMCVQHSFLAAALTYVPAKSHCTLSAIFYYPQSSFYCRCRWRNNRIKPKCGRLPAKMLALFFSPRRILRQRENCNFLGQKWQVETLTEGE